jgi:hypothetical protein
VFRIRNIMKRVTIDVPRVINDNHVREKLKIRPVTNQITITAPKTIHIQADPGNWTKGRHVLVMTELP